MLQEEESHVEFSCNVTSNFNRKLKFLFIVEAGLLLDRNSQNTFTFLLCFVSKLNWYLLLCSAVFLVKIKPFFFSYLRTMTFTYWSKLCGSPV